MFPLFKLTIPSIGSTALSHFLAHQVRVLTARAFRAGFHFAGTFDTSSLAS
jgi:hypothetical protein